ncbi:endothelin-converting enzyme 1-like protein 3, partial [Leptotrombidium deliense]
MEDTAEQDVQQMIDVIISTLKDKVDSFSWIRGDKDLNIIRNKIEELSPSSSIGVGHPRDIDDMSKMARNYNGYTLTRNFLNNIFDGYRFKRTVEERKLTNPSGSVNLNWNIKPTDIRARYEYAGNQLTVGMGLFQYPFYERSLPIAMKFGALGFQIGSAMMNF